MNHTTLFYPYFPFGVDHDVIKIVALLVLGTWALIHWRKSHRRLWPALSAGCYVLMVVHLYNHCAYLRWLLS